MLCWEGRAWLLGYKRSRVGAGVVCQVLTHVPWLVLHKPCSSSDAAVPQKGAVDPLGGLTKALGVITGGVAKVRSAGCAGTWNMCPWELPDSVAVSGL